MEERRVLQWHSMETAEAARQLGSDLSSGLSEVEAGARLSTFGPNEFEGGERFPALRLLIAQFRSSLVLLLLAATAISALLGETLDALVILAIVLLAASTGFAQEYRAGRVVAALRRQLAQKCVVIRDGKKRNLDVRELVPGDLVVLSPGDRVPADLRLVQSFGLEADESQLTGESLPASKTAAAVAPDTPVPDRASIAFAGTIVTRGRGVGLVVATGRMTELGKIISATASVEPSRSPLEVTLDALVRKFGLAALAIIAALSIFGLTREALLGSFSAISLLEIFLFGVSLAIAAVPEALPAVVTATLAAGARVLSSNNALVRRMSAVETLGSTEVICFDKTGTLTKGEMTVTDVYAGARFYEVSGRGYAQDGHVVEKGKGNLELPSKLLVELARASVLCNDSSLSLSEGRWSVQGDPTEGALLSFASKLGVASLERELYPRVEEIPFTEERKMMTTVHRAPDGRLVAYMKGAPESVLGACGGVLFEGEVRPSSEMSASILAVAESMTGRGLRVLALAMKWFQGETEGMPAERDFLLLGLVAMADPLREDAVEAVTEAKRAGLLPVMITGDHKATASAVARQAGILGDKDLVLTGPELDKIGSSLSDFVERVTVYARISPLDKLRIVEAWKSRGRVVAMTGDGVNDAPALKKADIGIAMGKGTDAAKEASDMVLTDDSFATIVKAVQLGRWIRENVSKYILYLVQSNAVEVTVMGAAVLLLFPLLGEPPGALPLLPVHILYINLATDGLPAIALGLSPPLNGSETARGGGVFDSKMKFFLSGMALIQAPLFLIAFASGLTPDIDAARTRLFLIFVFAELALALDLRSVRESVLTARPHRLLVAAVVWEAALAVAIVLLPQGRGALHLTVPGLIDCLWVVVSVAVTFVGAELLKLLSRRLGI